MGGRADPVDESSPDEAAGVPTCSVDPGSAGQSCPLLAKVVHPRLLSVRECRPRQGRLPHAEPRSPHSERHNQLRPGYWKGPAAGRPGARPGRWRGQT